MNMDKTFINITNKDIYNEIKLLKTQNMIQHEQILLHQKETNGKVKLNMWIATTALSLILSAVLVFVGIYRI